MTRNAASGPMASAGRPSATADSPRHNGTTAIANSPEGQNCYAQRLVTFSYERDLTNQDVCTVQTLAGKMSKSGYTIISMLTDLTQTQSFGYRAKETP